MSVMIANDDVILAVVGYAVKNNCTLPWVGSCESIDQLATMISQMNLDAYNERYREEPETAEKLTYNSQYSYGNKIVSHINAYNLAKFLEYNCDEAKNYDKSDVKEFLERVKLAALDNYLKTKDDYNSLKWGLV